MPPSPCSLLVPCKDAATFLPRLWESVRAQARPFDDIICYDDGSTDGTAAVARSLGARVLVGASCRGVSYARNRLAEAAATPWIHFHDADDLIAPDFLARLGPRCEGTVDVASCDADWIEDGSRAVMIRWRYDQLKLASDPLRHLLQVPLGLNSTIIRRSAWQGVGGCNEQLRMWEDADVHIRLARAGARFSHLPEVLTWSLRRPDSFSHDYRASWRNRLAALAGYADDPAMQAVKPEMAEAAEVAAASLADLGDTSAARAAITLCRRLGGDPPTTRHPGLRLLKRLLPRLWLLRWQARHRQRIQ